MNCEWHLDCEKYDAVAVLASKEKETPGHIEICSGVFSKEKKFRYRKCEMMTADIQAWGKVSVRIFEAGVYYAYLFQKNSEEPVKQIYPCNEKKDHEKSGEASYKNQNKFHFSAPTGWLNDPVGLCFFRNRYHLFYQFNPASQQWGDPFWGHTTSTDLMHWEDDPIVLRPQPEITCNSNVRGGAFSGSALVEQGKMHLFFTRHAGNMDKTRCMEYTAKVSSIDGFAFGREQMVLDDLPAELGENFRDPKVWREGDEWLMLTGTETKTDAAVSIHRSGDLVNWEYKGIFLCETDKKYIRAECPSILKIDGKEVLIAGYHNRYGSDIRRDVVYYIGQMQDYRFQVEKKGLLDYGKDFYAAQTFANTDRPLLIAWINDLGNEHIEDLCYSNGSMSLPREIWIESGKLYSFPAKEIEMAETQEETFKNILEICDGRGHLHIDFIQGVTGSIRLSASEAGEALLILQNGFASISIDGDCWQADERISEADIYMDQALFEIFFDHGRYAYTRRYERYETDHKISGSLSEGCKGYFSRVRL